ncbi:MAG: hypothetical protein M3R13_04760 [Armatimonadota bacterium]|nr:hypothetical protein [Armatimonadota bacterium]
MRLPQPPFRYFRVAGPDRIEWLQGQITQDLRLIPVGGWAQCAALTPTGQMVADGAVHIFENEVLLGLDRRASDTASEILSRRIVMEDVEFQAVPDLVTSIIGDGEGLPAPHILGGCNDSFGSEKIDAEMSHDDYNIARIEAAVPLFGVDYDSKTLAMELGKHFVATRIAFGKGCYTGQEIVERIRSRGRTHRTWAGLRSAEPLEKVDGVRITSSVLSPRLGHIALGFVPADSAESGMQFGPATVVDLPFS